jgi:DNA repair protein RecN (Recombination protein N)
MLIQLSVENVAIIEKLTVEFDNGLNILTGETGAGKSILIDALNALLGGRVSREVIRTGEDKATVEAVFLCPVKIVDVLNNMGIEIQDDQTLILSRRFFASGRNICRVNGSLVTVSQLREIGEYLVDIHGQHDNQSLLRNKAQSNYLDLFSGSRLLSEKESYGKVLSQYNEISRKITELKAMERERARLEDLYRYQAEEISAAALTKGEDIELTRQSKLLSHAESIIEAFNTAYSAITGEDGIHAGALDQIQQAQAAIDGIAALDQDFQGIAEKLIEIIDSMEDLARDIRQKKERINYDPYLQQEVEERLALIDTLKRKYGNTVEEIIEYGEKVREKLEEVTSTDEVLKKLIAQRDQLDNILYQKALELHKMRTDAASILKERITAQLRDLEMPKAEFEVDVRFDETRKYTENGLDSIEFLISPNPGEGFKPLNKIASGGEMSRIMLAIKTILADVDDMDVLIFDEIDTGVSGKAALKVGEKLLEVSAKHQVICITHHAQIASLANAHFYISKSMDGSRTMAHVKRLFRKEQEAEIARLISGDNNETTIGLAKQMLCKGTELRKEMK